MFFVFASVWRNKKIGDVAVFLGVLLFCLCYGVIINFKGRRNKMNKDSIMTIRL